MKKQKNSLVLYCFSPPVMAATFLIEIILAIYVLIRYKLNDRSRIIVAILVCLAGFQLAEYYVCTQNANAYSASRAGFVLITLLPALGFYLMSLLTKPLSRKSTIILVSVTAIVASYFLLVPQVFNNYECTGNYVIFQIGAWQIRLFSLFYFSLIFLSAEKGIRFLRTKLTKEKARPVQWLLAGYAAFILPVAVMIIIQPKIFSALPSVLCGFAVALALILALRVAPYMLSKR